MALAPGARLGPYEILAPLGAGGMGEVYKARDTRLGRTVAIKVLPDAFARDADRLARFEREARAVAAISHPNILDIHDIGSDNGRTFVVAELLDGETLRERINRGALPVRKAIEIGIQITRGLAAAHDKGIVHRDLKPENVFLIADGQVKILDFGLARHAAASGPGSGATETAAAVTDPGTVLGTAGYMAPEQVRGQAVDARADVFAFGAVLYEMVAGTRAFKGDTSADTMTAILKEDPPDLAGSRPDLSPALDRIVRHCLEKNPAERFQSARDVAFALESLSESGTGPHARPATEKGAAPSKRRWIASGFAGGLVMTLAALAAWQFAAGRAQPAGPCGGGAAPLAIGKMAQVTPGEGLEIDPALSPDGKLLAYAAGTARRMRVFIRPVAGGRAIPLSDGTDAFEFQPRWSPDGNQILYLTPDEVRVAPSLGGASRRIAGGGVSAAAWAPDGARILVIRRDALSIAPLDGGPERALGNAPQDPYQCDWSRESDRIACAYGSGGSVTPGPTFGNIAPSGIVVGRAAGGPFVEIVARRGLNQSPVWSPDGQTVYFVSSREGLRDIYAIGVSADGLARGEPCRVTTGLGAQVISLAAGGTRLAYEDYGARSNIWSVPIPSNGIVDASGATPVTSGNQIVEAMKVSRDGRWLLYDSTLFGDSEIFRVPVFGGPAERMTIDPADDFAPDLSPDGRLVAFHSFRLGGRDVFVQSVDGGVAQPVAHDPVRSESYPAWSPDGGAMLLFDQAVTPRTLLVIRKDASGSWSAPVQVARDAGRVGTWLPDGRSFVYASSRGDVLVASVEGGPPQIVYSPAPGSTTDPIPAGSVLASADGRTFYFKSHNHEGLASIWSVAGSGGRPRQIVRFDAARPSIRADFAVGAGRIFFTIEERQANIVVADLVRPPR
jgi:Tol biopolymer transport system component